jgi:hypothetical protein
MANENSKVHNLMSREISSAASNHQALLDEMGIRTSQGSFYTPLDVVEFLVSHSLQTLGPSITKLSDCPTIIDPACGTGNFLIVAAIELSQWLDYALKSTNSIDYVVSNCIYGCDIDRAAINHCLKNLSSLTDGRVHPSDLRENFYVGDALTLELADSKTPLQMDLFSVHDKEPTWNDCFPRVFNREQGGFDIVIGNPPFLNQLSKETALTDEQNTRLSRAYGDSLSRLTNTASIFFLQALNIARPSGVISLIQPMSFLATRESENIRQHINRESTVKSIWVCSEKVFDASVQVVAVTLSCDGEKGPIQILDGRAFNPCDPIRPFEADEKTWSRAITGARKFPKVSISSSGCLADIAQITGDFRDQYYGIIDAVVDNPEPNEDQMKLATVGLIDPGAFLWGEVSTKFAKNSYKHPVVNVTEVKEHLASWIKTRRQPKIIIATQTKILECYVDSQGNILPSVPLVTVLCDESFIWKIAAVISSPPISLLAAERHLGSGMSADVLKLGAKDFLDLPLPLDMKLWSEGANEFRRMQSITDSENKKQSLITMGEIMCKAYSVETEPLMSWWLGRLPRGMRRLSEEKD